MFGPIKRSYIDGAFSDLDYIDWNQELTFLEQTENPEYVFLYAFILLDLWESVFPNRKELTFDEISNVLLYNRYLGLNVEDCNVRLELGSGSDILRIYIGDAIQVITFEELRKIWKDLDNVEPTDIEYDIVIHQCSSL